MSKRKKIRIVEYQDRSDEDCPYCGGDTVVTGGHDESPGLKYEWRKCNDCYKTFKLILSW